MAKKGDTLIEVTLAVGIFSMVAISIVAVMTAGTSNAQTALETTLAREEIDTQAEALRFIHAAYLSSTDDENHFSGLWKEIVNNAYEPSTDSENNRAIQQYNPVNCRPENIFNPGVANHAFIINPRQLNLLSDQNARSSDVINGVYIRYRGHSESFPATQTYPRLVYSSPTATSPTTLVEDFHQTVLTRAEGIYVLAVKDPNSTKVPSGPSTINRSAYYDFYIRTCWFGTGSDTPTTISTVIRLYNPENISR